MKKIFTIKLVLLILVFLLAGCSQQAKETKTSNELSFGWPVKVGLQSEEGLPVTVSKQHKDGLPVRIGLPNDLSIPVEIQSQKGQPVPISLSMPNDRSIFVEIDTKGKQVLPVKVDGLDNLEKFLKAVVADMNSFSVKLNLPDGAQFPPLQVSLQPISSKVLMAITVSILAVAIAVFAALLTAFFAWRTSLNMKVIEKKIRNSKIDK